MTLITLALVITACTAVNVMVQVIVCRCLIRWLDAIGELAGEALDSQSRS